MPSKLKVGVLGATGTVGQRFILQLANHPEFELHALGASSSSAGKTYADAVAGRWKQQKPIPDNVKNMQVLECLVDGFRQCDVVFSGLDSGPAATIEPALREADLRVFSNAKNYRMDPLCPLVVPLVNPDHFNIIPKQRASLKPSPKNGFIITNANCSTTGIVVPLKALQEAFGPLDKIFVSTMQAISGAGYPGVSSFDIMDNVVPYISGEEEKIESETRKILGALSSDASAFEDHAVTVTAHCNRVPVVDGHTECVSVSFQRRPPPSVEEVKEALRNYTCEAQKLGVHSAPKVAITVHDAPDRPQPRLDRDNQDGAGVDVGRVRACPLLDIKILILLHSLCFSCYDSGMAGQFVVLSNNVMIGAATSSVMNAEIALAKGFLS
ncbi:aspartate-semialdehyde dehydrogenase [Tilletia horrida]|nr:aspartate-semialdehyde dehydrogenase [Tilletia horrida]